MISPAHYQWALEFFSACPPVYTLPGTWNDPEKIAKCNETLIPHLTLNPNYTFGISIDSNYYLTSRLWSL